MKEETYFKMFVAFQIICVLLSLAVTCGICYVIWHFIQKIW